MAKATGTIRARAYLTALQLSQRRVRGLLAFLAGTSGHVPSEDSVVKLAKAILAGPTIVMVGSTALARQAVTGWVTKIDEPIDKITIQQTQRVPLVRTSAAVCASENLTNLKAALQAMPVTALGWNAMHEGCGEPGRRGC